jgi:sec-independent protein translocase protein TatB
MFDFSFSELALIGAVALIVLGPERLPKVARTAGEWLSKAQRYVSQVKADINREIELAELKKIKEDAQAAAQSLQSSVESVQGELNSLQSNSSALENDAAVNSDPWTSATDLRYARRYKSGPSMDELSDEIDRLKRELTLPSNARNRRRKYGPRARTNRPRICR